MVPRPAAMCFQTMPVVNPHPHLYSQQSAFYGGDAYQFQPAPYSTGYVCGPTAPVAAPGYVCAPAAPIAAPMYAVPTAQPPYGCLPMPSAGVNASSFPIGPQPGLNYHDAYKEPHAWHGRTRWQVGQDNMAMALKENVWENNEAMPHNPRPDQQFWCIELDGSKTLRTADTIENALRPGQWRKDPVYGNMYFVRAKPT